MRSLGSGPNPTGLESLQEEELRTQTHTDGRASEDTGRRRPSARPGERRTSPAHTRVWESSLQDWRQGIGLSKLPWLWDFVMVALVD